MAEETKKEKKPNAIQRWWRETMGEMRKVTWPSWADVKKLTIVVIIVMVAMGLVLGLLDTAVTKLIAAIV